MSKYKIAKEVAEAEFDRMCQAARIETDTSELPEKELAEFNQLRAEIVRDMQTGLLIVSENGRPVYTPPGAAKGYMFSPPTGATLIVARGKENDIESMSLAMASMAQVDRGEFSKLDRLDFYACSRVARLFLADR